MGVAWDCSPGIRSLETTHALSNHNTEQMPSPSSILIDRHYIIALNLFFGAFIIAVVILFFEARQVCYS